MAALCVMGRPGMAPITWGGGGDAVGSLTPALRPPPNPSHLSTVYIPKAVCDACWQASASEVRGERWGQSRWAFGRRWGWEGASAVGMVGVRSNVVLSVSSISMACRVHRIHISASLRPGGRHTLRYSKTVWLLFLARAVYMSGTPLSPVPGSSSVGAGQSPIQRRNTSIGPTRDLIARERMGNG